MSNEVKITDPSAEDIDNALEEIAGYKMAQSEFSKRINAVIWTWVSGSVATDKGNDGKMVRITWEWNNGYVEVRVFKA